VRVAAGVATLLVFCLYVLFQMIVTARMAAMTLGITSTAGQVAAIVLMGLLTTLCVYVGGMRGVTVMQVIKAVVLIGLVVIMAALVLGRYGFNLSALLGEAAATSQAFGDRLLVPGGKFGEGTIDKLGFVSQIVTVVLGHAALPYIFMRFNTVRDSRQARRSVSLTIGMIGFYYLCVIVLGFGAAAIIGQEAILASPGARDGAALLLAQEIGGVSLLAVLSAVVYVMILAVTAGLMMSAVAAFTHDIYANAIKRGRVDAATEARVARQATIVIGVLATVFGAAALEHNVAFLLALDVTIAASVILPVLVYGMFWRRFNTAGAQLHLRRHGGNGPAGRGLAGGVRPSHGAAARQRLRPVPHALRRDRHDPDRLRARLPRHHAELGARPRRVRRDGGARPDRRGSAAAGGASRGRGRAGARADGQPEVTT
jgi:cation/acetate symporter